MSLFNLPAENPRVRRVHSFHELLTTPFQHGVNALCWPRTLPGDFREVAEKLEVGDGITTLDEETLRRLPVSGAGRLAVGLLLEDQRLLREQGLEPVLDCVLGYLRDDQPGPVSTDVFSFHADSAPVETDTWLCTYYGPASEGLLNEEARRHVDLPETRAELLRRFAREGGEDGPPFLEYLSEQCYDLHYAALPGARPYSFGVGHLWRIAVEYPGSPVPPCIHRAPFTPAGQRRLLLIS